MKASPVMRACGRDAYLAARLDTDVERAQQIAARCISCFGGGEQCGSHRRRRMNAAWIMRVVVIVGMHRITVRERSELRGQTHVSADHRSVRARKAELREMPAQKDAAYGDAAGERHRETVEHSALAEPNDIG